MTARKRSPPAAAPLTFDDVLATADDAVRATALRLRAVVRAALPEADEGIHGGAKVRMALYSEGGPTRVICGIQPSGGRCLLYLHRVTQEDLPELPLRGKGKHARHVEFGAPDEIDAAVVERVLRLSRERMG